MIEPSDSPARTRALDPETSFIIQAPAGSGKTTLLTQRYLRLLCIVDEPESIVAITFTRKAAEEMRGRILGALRDVEEPATQLDPVTAKWAGEASRVAKRRNWQLLANPRRLRVQTIDSLAAGLARRGPLLSGIGSVVDVADNPDRMYRDAAHATISSIDLTHEWAAAVGHVLRYLDNDWQAFEQHLVEMLARRDQWLRFIVGQPHRGLFEDTLTSVADDTLGSLAKVFPESLSDELVTVARYVGANVARADPALPLAALADLESMPAFDSEVLATWQAIARLLLTGDGNLRRRLTKNEGFPPKDEESKQFKQRFAQIAAHIEDSPSLHNGFVELSRLPTTTYTDTQWQGMEALFSVLRLAAAELKLAFAGQGAVDFTEVSHAALSALGSSEQPSDLGLLLDYRLEHLLVDEFQDTSVTQYELITRLLEGWVPGDGRSLFLVGDPMQSVYRFRQAEVQLFIDTFSEQRFASVPVTPLQLTTNFRARPSLIDWLNDSFSAVAAHATNAFPRLPPLIAARDDVHTPSVHVHTVRDGDGYDEAQRIVEIVQETQLKSPTQSIGILVRGRRHVGVISAALGQAGVAVTASEIERLSDQEIVQDAAALTRALLHPADRTAWLAILRAPWCGLPLERLAKIVGENSLTVWQQILQSDKEVLATDYGVLVRLRSILARALEYVGREPIAELVERTWLALGGPHIYPTSERHHAERYFQLLAQYARLEPLITPTRLATLLEEEYVAPPATHGESVEIMTIHRAKGLEFDVVILPGLGRTPRAEQHRLLSWRQHVSPNGTRLLFAPIPESGTNADSIYEYLRFAEKRDLEQEAYRLLYVALTRARESLYLIGTLKTSAERTPQPRAGSFLRMLWPALEDKLVLADPLSNSGGTGIATSENTKQQIRRVEFAPGRSLEHQVAPMSLAAQASLENVEFSWASPIAKHIGTITHALLQRVAIANLSAAELAAFEPYVISRLRTLGVARSQLEQATQRIFSATSAAIESERGRWIFNPRHRDPQNEYSLAATIDGKVTRIIVDRTFVDENDVRWIIDYKTGVHLGGSKDAFVQSECERYRPQLDHYAAVMHRLETKKTSLGLYFPLLDAWVSWSYTP